MGSTSTPEHPALTQTSSHSRRASGEKDIVLNVFLSFSRSAQHPTYPTVLQALEIDDPVVANCLIDMRGVETILLIKVCFVVSFCSLQGLPIYPVTL